MKSTLCSILLLVGIGSAWGQTLDKLTHPPDGPTTFTFPNCSDVIAFHGKSKAIREIFPDDCLSVIVEDTKAASTAPITTYRVAPDPPDVPAITEMREECVSTPGAYLCPTDAMGSSCPCPNHREKVPEPTCKDTSRILQTAVDGKKWCHKPQP